MMVLHWIIFSVVLQIHTFEKSASFLFHWTALAL